MDPHTRSQQVLARAAAACALASAVLPERARLQEAVVEEGARVASLRASTRVDAAALAAARVALAEADAEADAARARLVQLLRVAVELLGVVDPLWQRPEALVPSLFAERDVPVEDDALPAPLDAQARARVRVAAAAASAGGVIGGGGGSKASPPSRATERGLAARAAAAGIGGAVVGGGGSGTVGGSRGSGDGSDAVTGQCYDAVRTRLNAFARQELRRARWAAPAEF